MIPITEETLLRRMNLKVGSHLSPSFYSLLTARLHKAVTWCLICYMIDVFWDMSRTHPKNSLLLPLGERITSSFFPTEHIFYLLDYQSAIKRSWNETEITMINYCLPWTISLAFESDQFPKIRIKAMVFYPVSLCLWVVVNNIESDN